MDAKFDHVAVAVGDRVPSRDMLLDVLGGTVVWQDPSGAGQRGFERTTVEVGGTKVEILEPDGPDSFLHQFLAGRGPGLHHLTWYFDDLDSAIAGLEERGARLIQVQRHEGRVVEAYVHPSSGFGVLNQLWSSREWRNRDRTNHPALRDLPAPQPSRGHLHHVTVVVPEVEPAVAFYQTLLGGDTSPLRNYGDMVGQRLKVNGIQIGFTTPSSPASLLARHLMERGPGLHQMAFYVPEIAGAVAAAELLGLRLVNRHPAEGPVVDIFIHPSNPTGALIRLQGWLNQD